VLIALGAQRAADVERRLASREVRPLASQPPLASYGTLTIAARLGAAHQTLITASVERVHDRHLRIPVISKHLSPRHMNPRRIIGHSNIRLRISCPGQHWSTRGIILNKDGSFQRTAKFRDQTSTARCRLNLPPSPSSEQRLASSGIRLGRIVEAQRHFAGAYPPNTFPDVASALVDAERRAQFEEAGAHYESSYFPDLPLSASGGGCRQGRATAL